MYLAAPRADSLVAGGQYIPPAGNNHDHLQPPKTRKYLAKYPLALSNLTEQCLVKTRLTLERVSIEQFCEPLLHFGFANAKSGRFDANTRKNQFALPIEHSL